MYTTWSVVSVIVALVSISALCHGQQPELCTTPSGTPGRCVPVRKCGYVTDFLRSESLLHNDTVYLESLICERLTNGSTFVCCPRLENEPNCGPFINKDRIFGGNDTEIGEFPWLALIRFQARNTQIHANCAGSLISTRYVVSAAHCFTEAKKKWRIVHSVRVAEWNFMNHRGKADCKQLLEYTELVCRKDYDIARIALHPDYRVNYAVHLHDIALIELATDVELNKFVAPICLPLDDAVLEPHGDGSIMYTAAGWGATDPDSGMSNLLKQIDLREFDKERCRKVFQVPSNVGIGDAHICAGGVRNEDTCHGDSGGPLMEYVAGVWYLSGITSFGWPKCGKDGVPGVYTNITNYIGWIEYEVFRGTIV